MARYQYAGPGPDESSGEIIRPGDIREFDQEPDWGPWEPLDEPPEAERPPMSYTPVIGGKTIIEPVTAANDFAAAPPTAPKEM